MVFNESAGLRVSAGGTLTAVGTASEPIVFTGKEETAGYWDGIYLTDPSRNSRLEYTQISYGGGDTRFYPGNITVVQSSLYVANSVISNSATWGICV